MSENAFRVLQWNISYIEPVAAVAEVIRASGADICLLQELTLDHHGSGIDVAAELGRRLGYQHYVDYQPGELPDGGTALMSSGILSRFPLSRQRSVDLGGRRYLEAVAGIHDGQVTVGTTHLFFHPLMRTSGHKRGMVGRLLENLPVSGSPYVFGGDLNAPAASAAAKMVRSRLRHAGPALSHPTWSQQPVDIGPFHYDQLRWRLDYVLYQDLLRPVRSQTYSTPVSDHQPVLVDFVLG